MCKFLAEHSCTIWWVLVNKGSGWDLQSEYNLCFDEEIAKASLHRKSPVSSPALWLPLPLPTWNWSSGVPAQPHSTTGQAEGRAVLKMYLEIDSEFAIVNKVFFAQNSGKCYRQTFQWFLANSGMERDLCQVLCLHHRATIARLFNSGSVSE